MKVSFRQKNTSGFTLIEMMINIAIFTLIAGFLVSLVMIALRIQNKEVAGTEVGGQLNFIMQTIQRLTRESEGVSVGGVGNSTLTLDFTSQPARDPTIISLNSGAITLKEGADPVANLTNARVIADQLTFARFINPPAADTVQISIALRYDTGNPFASTTKKMTSSASPLTP